MAQALSVTEAVALVGLEEKSVRKEVEYGLFGSVTPPKFKLPALVYLRVLRELGIQTTVEERKMIYRLITKAFDQAKRPSEVRLSRVLQLNLDEVTEEVQSKLERFETWKRKIVINPKIMGGEPVFPNSRLTVRHIGAMMLRSEGGAEQEIREDYPYLKREDIEFARQYTVAYPKVGRPRATRKAAAG